MYPFLAFLLGNIDADSVHVSQAQLHELGSVWYIHGYSSEGSWVMLKCVALTVQSANFVL